LRIFQGEEFPGLRDLYEVFSLLISLAVCGVYNYQSNKESVLPVNLFLLKRL
jgi:hypothetical protein